MRLFRALSLLAAMSAAAAAAPGVVLRFPPVTSLLPNGQAKAVYSSATALRGQVSFPVADPGGYQRMRLEVESQGAVLADTAVEVRVTLGNGSAREDGGLTLRRRLVIPRGERSARGDLLYPIDAPRDWVRVRCLVNDREAPELDAVQGVVPAVGPATALRVVRPGKGPPLGVDAFRSIAQLVRGQPVDQRFLDGWSEIDYATEWLGYSGADVVSLDLAELRGVAESPERLTPIRRWVAAGGTLWLERVGPKAEGLLEVDRLLGLDSCRFVPTPDETEPEDKEAPPAPGSPSQRPDAEPTVDELLSGSEPAAEQPESRPERRPTEGAPGWWYDAVEPPPGAPGGPASTAGWYAARPTGFGRVLAFVGRSTDAPPAFGPGLAESVRGGWVARNWASRHGIEPGASSSQFGDLLIPGLGVAPVGLFQVLITLFVLAVGPLNYWLLWRRGELQLLAVTAPLGAALATLGLVGYATVADGFGVKARVRSVALVDQRSGEAATWARATHYVATSPGGPAEFPGDTAIYPITPAWESAVKRTSQRREFIWADGKQRLLSGWMPSRSTVQHLIVRGGSTDARVAFTGQGDSLSAVNRLGADVSLLLVRDADGAWRSARGIAAGESAKPAPIPRRDALQAYRELALANEPELPAGAGKAAEQTLERLGAAQSVRQTQRNLASVSLDAGLGERQLDALSGMDGGRGIELPPRSYVAVTPTAVTTPLGWDAVEELGSFHVLVGRW